MAPNKKQKKKMKRPQNRKLMIRDLPPGAAPLLHPSLRKMFQSQPKRWNRGSPALRIYINILRKYKKQTIPRTLPFFCDHCRMSSRYFSHIKDHVCDREEKRKAARKEDERKYSDYDCTNEMKLAMNAEKQWRFNALASLEQSLQPDKIMPKKVAVSKIPKETEHLDSEPEQEFYEAQEKEFVDDIPHYSIDEVLIDNSQLPRPVSKLKPDPIEAGIFCFNCKGSFESYSQFNLHLLDSYNNGKCSKALPDTYYFERNDRTGMFDPKYKYSVRHHRPMTRDVSHVQCTSCKASNFSSPGDLYAHMVKCASAANLGNDAYGKNQTAFGYGMPPSFNACHYVFPDPTMGRDSNGKAQISEDDEPELSM